MGCGVAVIHSSLFPTSCWLRESIPHSHPGWFYAQLPTMDHDYSKPVMPILFFYASNLSRAELVIQVCPKRSKVGGRAWMRWGTGMVLMRESWEMRGPFGPVPPFLTCVPFYDDMKLWEPWDAKPKPWAWGKGRLGEEGLPWHNRAACYTWPDTANSQTSF